MIYAKTITVVDTTERDRALQVCSGRGWGGGGVRLLLGREVG